MTSTETSGEHDLRAEADRLFLEHIEGLPAGAEPRPAELEAAHPDLAEALRAAAQDWAWLEERRSGAPSEAAQESVEPRELAPDAIDRLAAQPIEERYTILDEVGRGGMGTVFRAWDARLRRVVAMKVSAARRAAERDGGPPPRRSRSLFRFLEEAQVMAQLDHPGVLSVHDVGVDLEGRLWFTMPMVGGLDLARVLALVRKRDATWTTPRVLGVLVRVCETLAFAHGKGVVHRDVKPSNVMVGRHGEAYVMDWGLARVRDRDDVHAESLRSLMDAERGGELFSVRREEARRAAVGDLLTIDGSAIGTPSFMSPEQARGELGEVGPLSDVYAAGAILYELLAGRPPYTDRSSTREAKSVLNAVRTEPPTPVSKLAPGAEPELVAICAKAMARQPGDRYADMEALADDLRAYLEGRVVSAHRTGLLVEAGKWVRRNRLAAAALAATTAALVGGLAATAYVQTEAKNELSAANATIRAESKRARRSEADAMRLRDAADLQAYAARIAAAQGAIAQHRVDLAREQLERCPPELRGWEWSYLSSQLDGSLMTLRDPEADQKAHRVWDVSWSRDGELLASTHEDGQLRVWSAASGELLRRIPAHRGLVTGLEFTPDGDSLVSVSESGRVLVSDVHGESEPRELFAAAQNARDIDLSPDGSLVAIAYRELYVARVADGDAVLRHRLSNHAVSVDFSPDGERVLVCDRSNRISVIEVASGRTLASFRAPDGAQYAHHRFTAAFHPDGERLAVMPQDGDVRLMTPGFEVERHLNGAGVRGWSMAFSPDGALIAATATDSATTVWDTRTGERVYVAAGHGDVVRGVAWSPDGERFATASIDGTVKLWSPRRRMGPERLSYAPNRSAGAVFTPDGRYVITANPWPGLVVWDLDTGTIAARLAEGYEDTWTVALGPDGRRLAGGDVFGNVRVFDGATLQPTHVIPAHAGEIVDVAVSPEERTIASVGANSVVLTDAETGNELARLDGASLGKTAGAPLRIAFGPRGDVLAIACRDELVVWDRAERRVTRRAAHGQPSIRAVAFHPDGGAAVTCGASEVVRVWDTTDWSLARELRGHVDWVRAATFTPDGTRLATTGRDLTVKLWDFASGEVVATFSGLSDWGADLAFSPDGRRMAVSSDVLHLFDPRPSDRDLAGLHAAVETLRAPVETLYEELLDAAATAEAFSARSDLSDLERRAAEHLARARPDGPGAHLERARKRLGWSHPDAAALDLALRSAERAAALAPSDAEAPYLAGRALAALGRTTEAADRFARANALALAANGTPHLAACAELARVHAVLGNAALAADYLATAAERAKALGDRTTAEERDALTAARVALARQEASR